MLDPGAEQGGGSRGLSRVVDPGVSRVLDPGAEQGAGSRG